MMKPRTGGRGSNQYQTKPSRPPTRVATSAGLVAAVDDAPVTDFAVWYTAGFDPSQAEAWAAAGFNVRQAGQWARRMFLPAESAELSRRGYSARQADRRKRTGKPLTCVLCQDTGFYVDQGGQEWVNCQQCGMPNPTITPRE